MGERRSKSKRHNQDIAIIGLAALFPGADNIEQFWQNLLAGHEARCEVPASRWPLTQFYDTRPGQPGKAYCPWGAFLDDVDRFDAAFFNIPPSEAEKMDPQQRLALQEAWHALEDAGYTLAQLAEHTVGVFVGARAGDYHTHALNDYEQIDPHLLMGHDTSMLSARIAHFLDLHGPDLTVNAACASAGVALHLACQSLRRGESQVALVGGAHIMTTPQRFLMHSRSGLLSPSGHCHAFDDRADGILLGEAVGFAVLKPLAQALADGDRIYACIKATGMSQNGHSPSITKPNPKAQAQLIRGVLDQAGIQPDTVTYVEAHGTGTRQGDAWELAALQEVYGRAKSRKSFCAVGSVKTNIGHTITAAFIPSLFKVALSFKFQQLPPSLHFDTPNALFDFDHSPFRIITEPQPWATQADQPRRAAISCFAYTGTNVHAILEEPPAATHRRKAEEGVGYLVPLSAKTETALVRQVQQLRDWLEHHAAEHRLGDVAYTLAFGRNHFDRRVAFIVRSMADLRAQLQDYIASGTSRYPNWTNEKEKTLVRLAQRYQAGDTIDWQTIFKRRAYRKLSLPTYPFDKERHWLTATHAPLSLSNQGGQQLPALVILARRDDVYQALKAQVDPARALVLVKPGHCYEQLGANIYQVDPTNSDDYLTLLHELGPQFAGTVRIFNLWNHDCDLIDYIYHDNIEGCLRLIDASLTFSLGAMAAIEQALTQFRGQLKIQIHYLYYGENQQLQPHHGLAAAFAPRAASLRVKAIRLAERLFDPEQLTQIIQTELLAADDDARLVQYTSNLERKPYVARQHDLRQPSSRPFQLRDDGCYLLVDRHGEYSTIAAQLFLTHQPKLRLLLMSERPQSQHQQIRHVGYPLADVAETQRYLVKLADQHHIHGIVYFQQQDPETELASQLAELLHLDHAAQHLAIDFFVTLSLVAEGEQSQCVEDVIALRQIMHTLDQRSGLSMAFYWQASSQDQVRFRQALKDMLYPAVLSRQLRLPTEQLERDLIGIVASTVKVSRSQIDIDTPIDGMQFNSLIITELSHRINRHYGTDVSPVLFFEHQTLRDVFHQFAQVYAARLIEHYGVTPEFVTSPTLASASDSMPAHLESMISKPPLYASQPVHHDQSTSLVPAVPSPSPQVSPAAGQPIAVIGMHGILPGSKDLDEFWEHLAAGDDLVTEVPADRWDWRKYAGHTTEPGKTAVRWGGFIENIDQFDAAFFRISPREAELMDPQQRLFLEVVWHTLEMSGYRPSDLAGSDTGVFVGVSTSDYNLLLHQHQRSPELHWFTGNMHSIIPNRVSYFFDWHGPSEPVDTACSSSLVAIHRAVTALQSGQCTLAVAGGVNLLLSPTLHTAFASAGMLSADGRCRTFDARANGYVRGEGCAAILLKPLHLAERDGDTIYAVITGSAVNHGGAVQSLTVPNPKAQAALLVEAYRRAQVDPRTVTFVETHGTGTPLGDPIEVRGLSQAFAALYEEWGCSLPHEPHCVLGAVKTNIGHLEAAAGIAGLLKVILALRHEKIPANLHLDNFNPHLSLDGTPFTICTETLPWPRITDERGQALPRRSGVSSFGFGGANAHVVIEEYLPHPEPMPPQETGAPELFVLSARTAEQLKTYARNWCIFLDRCARKRSPFSLADAAYTMQVGRNAMSERLALIVHSVAELREKLAVYCEQDTLPEGGWTAHISAGSSPVTQLMAGPAGEQFLAAIYRQRDLGNLAQLWLAGVEVDWAMLYPQRPARLSLPTYPFARQRYWFTATEPSPAPSYRAGPDDAFKQVEQFGALCLLHAFQRMGVFKQPGETYDPALLRDQLGIVDKYQPLYNALLTMVAQHGWLTMQGQTLTVTPEVAAWQDRLAGITQWRDQLLSERGDYQAYIAFLDSCLTHYPRVLTGQMHHLEAMFPGGDIRLVEAVYRQDPIAQRLNGVLADAVARLAQKQLADQPTRKLRILEVGAGTGSSAIPVLKRLQPYAALVEYWFTDISPGFVNIAAETYAGSYPFVQFKVLDIQGNVAEQLPAQSVDIVLAANVLHATRDMARTLRNVRALLKPQGAVLLHEVTRATNFTTLTFGLTDDWWAVDDPQRRLPAAPLLSLAQWQSLLAQHGFVELTELGQVHADDPLGRVVLMAQHTAMSVPVTDVSQALLAYLQNVFHRITKVPIVELKPDRNYDEFGVDSLLNLQIISALETDFGSLPKTLLYRENTLERLARYLLHEHAAAVQRNVVSTAPLVPEAKERGESAVLATSRLDAAVSDPQPSETDIAIVGLAGQYPQAADLIDFWENLLAGRDSVTEVPPSRWDYRRYPYREGAQTVTYPWGSFLDNIDHFDPRLFNIAPKDARSMDPHERLFLQTAWSVLEDAGYSRIQLLQNEHNPVGVFVGVTYNNYQLLAADQWAHGHLAAFSSQTVSVANRVSYHLNLSGPSIPIDTACSSSLTAVHLACESIRRGECEAAIAGGVNLSLHPSKYYYLIANGYLSPTGRCHPFSAQADGMVPGEGVGAVLLKPLRQAIADGNHIYGVIKGSACNHGGKVSGYTVPNPQAQARLIQSALSNAGIDPRTISYVEAHGTGTALGDPIEIMGLTDAYRSYTLDRNFCAIGSVKSNLGHLEAAAGIAGLTKVLLQLKYKKLVPTIHAQSLNPKIDFADSPFVVQTTLQDWQRPVVAAHGQEYLRRAAISSFGAGGVNAHLIVEEYQDQPAAAMQISTPRVFVLSAQSEEQLKRYAQRVQRHLQAKTAADLTAVAATLQIGREPMRHRLAIVADDRQALLARLAAYLDDLPTPEVFRSEAASVGQTIDQPEHVVPAALAQAWVHGATVAWARLYGAHLPRKVSLPTYPFAEESYWFPELPNAPAPAAQFIVETVAEASELNADAQPSGPPLPAHAQKTVLAEAIANLLCELLGIAADQIDPRLGFFQMGMESMQAVRLKQRLEQQLGLILPDTLAFEYPNVEALTTYLATRLHETKISYVAGTAAAVATAHHEANPPAVPAVPSAVERADLPETALQHPAPEPIAIIGMGLRFPGGATNPEAFWSLLSHGETTARPVPPERWRPDVYRDVPYTQSANFLDEPIDAFDAQFFNISPREATAMDPQQRLLLEVAWEALEHAGQAPDRLAGSRTGVFVGIVGSEYELVQDLTDINEYFATGVMANIAAGRVAFSLGLQGPTLAVDTACSSSLTALHLACQSLWLRECDMALAGGVNLLVSPDVFTALCKLNALALDGRCKTFDGGGDGYGRGEGCGVLVLKRLADAQADGDRVLAVVRGTALNHDGASSGLTVPNIRAQQALIEQALANARLQPDEVSYIEAHGTGTSLGDPIEYQALSAVFAGTRPAPLMLGSVKTNIGHLEAAAGIASVIKTILALQHQVIPPHPHLSMLNPRIDLAAVPAVVPTRLTPWRVARGERIAGVSSFGFSGTNVHALIAQAPPAPGVTATASLRAAHVLTLSAKTQPALVALARRYQEHLAGHHESRLGDICFTTSVGRAHFKHRLALVVATAQQCREQLAAFVTQPEQSPLYQPPSTRSPKIALVLGEVEPSSWMTELANLHPHVRQLLEACDSCFQAQGLPSCMRSFGQGVADPLLRQALMFSAGYALVGLLRHWGVQSAVTIGQGVGELVVASDTGALSLEVAAARVLRSATLGQPQAAAIEGAIQGCDVILSLANQQADQAGAQTATWLHFDPRRAWPSLMEIVAALYQRGMAIEWQHVHQGSGWQRITLPTYPFQRKSYWHAPRLNHKGDVWHGHRSETIKASPLVAERIASPLSTQQFQFHLSGALLPAVHDTHRLVHVGLYQEMLASALKLAGHAGGYHLLEIDYQSPLVVPEQEPQRVQLVITPGEELGVLSFQFYSLARNPDGWLSHVSGQLRPATEAMQPPTLLAAVQARCPEQTTGSQFYQQMRECGVALGESVRWLEHLWRGEREVLARLRPPLPSEQAASYTLPLPPGVLDSCAQLAHAALPPEYGQQRLYMVVRWEGCAILPRVAQFPLWCHVTLNAAGTEPDRIDVTTTLLDSAGQPIVHIAHSHMCAITTGGPASAPAALEHEPALPPDFQALPQNEQQQLVARELQRQLGQLLELDAAELDADESLRSFGMDSLVAMQLRAAVERQFQVQLPISELLVGPSVRQLAQAIVGRVGSLPQDEAVQVISPERLQEADASPASASTNGHRPASPWIAYRQPRQQARIRLFCLPYGGGGASLYRHWQQHLPNSVEVCPIQLPGREDRFSEPAARRLDPLVSQIAEAILPLLDRPFAFYGHSFGALISYRLAQLLDQRYGRCASQLFAAAYTAPHLPNTWLQHCLRRLYQIGYSVVPPPEAVGIKQVQEIFLGSEPALCMTREHPELLAAVMPTLLADLSVVDSSMHHEQPPLNCPITAFGGVDDERVPHHDIAAWRALTSQAFHVQLLPGDHFFLHPDQSFKEVIRMVAEQLTLCESAERVTVCS